MAACCALSAYIIYKLISIHSRLPSLGLTTTATAALQPEKAPTTSCVITLRGLTCLSCVDAVEDACRTLPGVEAVNVSLPALTARIQYDAGRVTPDLLIAAIESAGFDAVYQGKEQPWASQWQAATRAQAETLQQWTQAFTSSAMVSGVVYLLEIVEAWIDPSHAPMVVSVVTSAITVAALWHLGRPIHKEAWWALRRRRPNASLLASSGVLFTFIAALLSRDAHRGSFRMTSACLLMTVVIGGRVSKGLLSHRGNRYPALLASSIPPTAQLFQGSTSVAVAVDLLHPGDLIRVEPQTPFPADCRLVDGHTCVLETIVNGEVVPKTAGPGDSVYAGSTNASHAVVAEVCAVGNDSWLGQTLHAMEQTRNSRPDMSADPLLTRFSSAVILLALLTGLDHWWQQASLSTTVSRIATVLLCACPCTLDMGLSMCIMTAVSTASQAGILLRPGVQIESAAHARAIIFDKTGTLTAGTLQIQDIHLEPRWAAHSQLFWRLTARLAQTSPHPVSALLSEQLQQLPGGIHPSVALLEHEDHPGLGLTGILSLDGTDYVLAIGNLRLMHTQGVYPVPDCPIQPCNPPQPTNQPSTERSNQLSNPNPTPNILPISTVYISINNHLAGRITYTDPLRPDTLPLIHALHAQNLTTFLLTGDTKASASAVARAAGIPPSHVYASQRPQQKAELVSTLQSRHGPAVMVGDNLNDVPALAAATFGILVAHRPAEQSGVLAGVHAEANALLVEDGRGKGPGLRRVVDTLDLLRRTARRMRLVARLSMGYNVVVLGLASGLGRRVLSEGGGGWVDLDPARASLAMALSSILTLGVSSRV